MTDLTGKTAIVTGAGRGLGRAMAAGLVEAGATVALVELDRDVLDEAVENWRWLYRHRSRCLQPGRGATHRQRDA